MRFPLRWMLDHGSAVLRYVRQPRRDQLIAQLPTATALAFRLLLTYPEDTVGAWINTHCLAVAPETLVSEALERLRQSPESVGPYLYVVDADRRLQGMAAMADLLRAGRGATVAQTMQPARHRLSARASLAAAHQHQGWKEYHALPVLQCRPAGRGAAPRPPTPPASTSARRSASRVRPDRLTGAAGAVAPR
ncbi:CBS domain-containing protein [uncultured Brevundimonas sp.]|uniref:CBS domain-containing protein n=1 Tax=uncultured Brevundimonas sp. TaxID=213418 RepID=UPI00260E58A8|nr:CBS domain-containing protein [uncultured Brevundimonas sp.]